MPEMGRAVPGLRVVPLTRPVPCFGRERLKAPPLLSVPQVGSDTFAPTGQDSENKEDVYSFMRSFSRYLLSSCWDGENWKEALAHWSSV